MSLDLKVYELLYLLASFHGVFLATLIILKRYSRENAFLFFLVLLFSFYLLENVVYSSGHIVNVPHLFFTTLPLIYLIGPLFFLYIRSSVRSSPLRSTDLFHLFPFLFEFIILVPFYMLDGEIKIKIYERSQQSSGDTDGMSIYFVGYLVYLGSTFFYFFKSLRLLQRASNIKMTVRRRKKFKSLQSISIGFFLYVSVSVILSILSRLDYDVREITFHVNLSLLMVLVHTIGYIVFLNHELLDPISKPSGYQYSSLPDEKKKQLSGLLLEIMKSKKLHLNANVSPGEISTALQISTHELSQLLSVELKTSFYDFINGYRIQHAKELLNSEKYRDAKILHVALDSGFSNKSTFLRNFKKSTGLTPTGYKNLHKNQVSTN